MHCCLQPEKGRSALAEYFDELENPYLTNWLLPMCRRTGVVLSAAREGALMAIFEPFRKNMKIPAGKKYGDEESSPRLKRRRHFRV